MKSSVHPVVVAAALLAQGMAPIPALAQAQVPEAPRASPASQKPLSPEETLASFHLEPGLRIELVAAEPTVVDPVAMAFDENGRMFVAENRGYPTGPGEGKPPAGIIAVLEDIDGDGRYEKQTVFADGLTFPNGVMPWKGGLFVTCAPDLLYLKDTDGDGRADLRQVVFTGFSTSGSTQLRVSHPTLGIDGWVYLTSGLTGGKVTSPDYPDRPPIDLKTDFRFRPGTDEFEAADGRAQFGLTFDDFGNRFICMNRVQVEHVVLPSRYLRRNPRLAFSDTVQNCPEHMLPEPLRGHGASARIYPISDNVVTADSHAGTFTAACGVMIYRGTALPEEYRGNALSCDPTGNLVHRDLLVPKGASFVARRASEGTELLASTDNWFRPVFLANGPDGALYICAMYRKTIEHPEYLPEEIRKRTDFDSGKGMGRIYRVVATKPKDKEKQPTANLAGASSDQLCEQLDNPNAWNRDTAFRLLLERQDKSAAAFLRKSFGKSGSAGAAVVKLRALAALGGLANEAIVLALRSEHARVRESALQLVEPRLGTSTNFFSLVEKLADDPDARVRFQCALSLGNAPFPRDQDDILPPPNLRADPSMVNALARIAARDAGDRWTRAAILSSASGHGEALLEALMKQPASDADGIAILLAELGRILASYPPRFSLFNTTLESREPGFDRKAAFLAGYADGLRDQGPTSTLFSALGSLKMLSSNSGTGEALSELFRQAREIAIDGSQRLARRLGAVALLAHADAEEANTALLPLLDTREAAELQASAARALAQPHNLAGVTNLLSASHWPNYTPALRNTVLAAVLARAEFIPTMLTAIESGALPAGALDGNQRNQLLKHKNDAIRLCSEKLFAQMVPGDRRKAYEDAKLVLNLKPNPVNGRAVFKTHCASCHRLDRDGVPVGPDLFGIRNQPKEAILLHIIVPEYEITPGFAGYTVETKDGRTLSGLIASETAVSVTLRRAAGEEETLLRSNIASMSTSNLSLMPQEMEKNMSAQDLADLIAYLKGEGPANDSN